MKALALACVSFAVAGAARAQSLDGLAAGAPVYAVARPAPLAGALKRLGVGDMPELQQLKTQLGGIDPLDPALLSPTGIDPVAPVRAALFLPAGPHAAHHRVLVTLKDPSLLRLFLVGVMASGQVPLQPVGTDTPLGRQGALATALVPKQLSAVVRIDGTRLVIDLVTVDKVAPPAPAELVRRYPLEEAGPSVDEHGARALLSSQAALALWVDGQKLGPLLTTLGTKVPKGCAEAWQKAPGTFADAALALSVSPSQLSIDVGWAQARGSRLQLSSRDDDLVDAQQLSRVTPAMIALYAASLQPFQALKRGGPLATSDTLDRSVTKCGGVAGAHLAVRSWPEAVAALVADAKPNGNGNPLVAQAAQSLGSLRNVVLAFRGTDGSASGTKYFAAVSLNDSVRPLLELALAAASQGGHALKGNPAVTVYELDAGGYTLVMGLHTLKSGTLGLSVADSEDGLADALRRPTFLPGQAPSRPSTLPLVALSLDGKALDRLAADAASADIRNLTRFLARLGRLDGELRSQKLGDSGLFRLTLHAPMKQ